MEPVVLFITGREIDMMQDTIHEGLDALLGPERVWCYPYKDYSSFQYNLEPPAPDTAPHRVPVDEGRIARQRHLIAAVVVGSVREDTVATWRGLQGLFSDVPVGLIHGDWLPDALWPADLRSTHRFRKDLEPGDAEPGVYPIAYSAPERVMLQVETERDIPLSFVARSTTAIRPELAKALRAAGFFVLLDADIPRDHYCWILARSKIAVSARGAAWDSLRYFEIPYQGALLLGQSHPIVIPDDFVDGESAVYYATADDAVAKAKGLLGDLDRLRRIAAAGQDLARRAHTAARRARYVLETMGVLDRLGLTAGAVTARPAGAVTSGPRNGGPR